ncbi:hypothetical protein [Fulvitalea axinellae]|uniref:hypothetical protein n=1 Tax=Fulvitalea axinellae TaxID=1182444 RepID=UPI0030CA1B4F
MDNTENLILLMLHSVGGGLMACGVGMFVLVHYGIRKNVAWARWSFLLMAWLAQGFNGYGMFMSGSYYFYPVLVLFIATTGIFLYRKERQFYAYRQDEWTVSDQA